MTAYYSDYNQYYEFIRDGEEANTRLGQAWQRKDVVAKFPCGLVARRPRDNPAIGIIEMLQFVAGIFDWNSIATVAPNARLDLFTQQSAYGPRALTQILDVINELRQDPESRRAVVVIARPTDRPGDRPCTMTMQFQLYFDTPYNQLDVSVYMRSSDTVWGMPYDLIQFSGVLQMVAAALDAIPGHVVMHLGNGHIYLNNQNHRGWTHNVLVNRFTGNPAADIIHATEVVRRRPTRVELEGIYLTRGIV